MMPQQKTEPHSSIKPEIISAAINVEDVCALESASGMSTCEAKRTRLSLENLTETF